MADCCYVIFNARMKCSAGTSNCHIMSHQDFSYWVWIELFCEQISVYSAITLDVVGKIVSIVIILILQRHN
jgi:hypothetical protein